MKTLYIGPYKYNNFFGICSRNIIESLKDDNIDLKTHNIYLNNPYSNTTLVEIKENKQINIDELLEYDYIIQHGPISMLCPRPSLGKKNIAIPILDYTIDSSELEILKDFDHTIIDDPCNMLNLQKEEIQPLYLQYLFVPKKLDYKINFEYHSPNKKFYFIGEFKSNQNMLNKIITSFIIATRVYDNVSLILMLTDDNTAEADHHSKSMIDNIIKKLNYKDKLIPIKIICVKPSIDDLHMMHQDCDVLIDLYDNYNSGINHAFASLYGKAILDMMNLETILVPSVENLSHISAHSYKRSVLTSSLISAIKNYCENNTLTYPHIDKRHIKDILC